MKTKIYISLILAALLAFIAVGCSDDDKTVRVVNVSLTNAKQTGDGKMLIELYSHRTVQLEPMFMPQSAVNKEVVYEYDSDAFTVSESGLLEPIGGGGDGTVTVKLKDGSGIFAKYNVLVHERIVVDGPNDLIERFKWKVTSLYPYAQDGNNGPLALMLDSDPATYMSIGKPGRAMAPDETECYITIELPDSEEDVEYFRMRHRDASRAQLKVWEVTIQGSDDGEEFVDIAQNVAIPSGKSTTAIESENINIPKTSYKFYRFYFTDWNRITGNSMQVAELYLGFYYQK